MLIFILVTLKGILYLIMVGLNKLGSFGFTAYKTGAYILHLGNEFSGFSQIVVTVTYELETEDILISNIKFWLAVGAGVSAVLLLTIGVGLFLYDKRRKVILS